MRVKSADKGPAFGLAVGGLTGEPGFTRTVDTREVAWVAPGYLARPH